MHIYCPGAFQPLGTVTEMMTVWTEAMSLLVTVNPKVEHASAICSHATTATVFLEFTSATETTIV